MQGLQTTVRSRRWRRTRACARIASVLALLLPWTLSSAHAQVTAFGFVRGGPPAVALRDIATFDTAARAPFGLPLSMTLEAPIGVAVTPDGRLAYVTNLQTSEVYVVDIFRNTISATIAVQSRPLDIVIGPDSKRAYVILESPEAMVSIALETNTVVGPPFMLSGRPYGIRLSANGARAYITSREATGSCWLNIVDVRRRTLVDRIALPTGVPWVLALTPDEQRAYVGNLDADSLTRDIIVPIDLTTRTATSPITVGDTPSGMAITPDSRLLFVTSLTEHALHVIDTAANTVIQTVSLAAIVPNGLDITPDGQQLWVLDTREGMAVVDVATRQVSPQHVPISRITAMTGRFLGPSVVGRGFPQAPLTFADDAELTAFGFGQFVNLADGTLRLTGHWSTTRTLSVLRVQNRVGTIDTNGFDATLETGVWNDGTLIKRGAGTLRLRQSSVATPSGSMQVSGGTLIVDGTEDMEILVLNGELGGTGRVNELLAISTGIAAVSPGDNGPGILQAGSLLCSGCVLRVDLHGPDAGTGYDRLDVSGRAELTNATLELRPTFVPPIGARFTILTNVAAGFAFQGLPEGGELATSHGLFRITYVGGDGDDLMLTMVDAPPRISELSDQTILMNHVAGPLPFSVTDDNVLPAFLVVSASSSNQALLPDANIQLGGSGTSRTLTATPIAGVTGSTRITVRVQAFRLSAERTFTLTVEPPPTYVLAEGATGTFFDTDILIANPHATPTPITITFLTQDGRTVAQDRTLAATSRTTIRVDEIPELQSTAVSTLVTSPTGAPLVVERTMRWDATGYGAHTEKATAGAAREWYFAEGAQGFFFTYFLLVNPQAATNTARVTYLREDAPPLVREYALQPRARLTVDAGSDPDLRDRSFGAVVTFRDPGVAERAMYFGRSPLFTGGHGSAGVTAPATRWFLAEGATGSFFTTFILLANPGAEDANVTVTYLPATGTPVVRRFTVPAGQRVTRNVANEDVSLASEAVATQIDADRPLVVERAQYWPNPVETWAEAHNSFGLTETARRWGLAEGRVGGTDAAQTYILLANPGAVESDVRISFLRVDGSVLVKRFVVPPTSRFNVAVAGSDSQVPELADESFGAIIDATEPIAVERAMYGNVGNAVWAAGTNATATRLP
jgi:YVTN family beta-propeller protein/autotransporter-associated beta strand protein